MQFVCDDGGGSNAKWYYQPEHGQYVRINSAGIEQGRIKGEYLPDPVALLEWRAKVYPAAPLHVIQPTAATVALWEHWNVTKQIAH